MPSPYLTPAELLPVPIFVDLSVPGDIRILSDEEIAKFDKDKPPAGVHKEISYWRRPNWAASTMIA